MKVLIVDDDPDMREAISSVLTTEGHRSIAVMDGREALDYLEHGSPICLILLDLMMPVMNGWEFRKRQQLDPKIASIPVVVITADGNAPEKARQLQASGYLRKPMDADDLIGTVEKFCPAASPGSST